MDKFERIVHWLSQLSDRVARWALVIMMLVVVANILLRAVWQSIPGTFEYVGYLGAVVIGFALAFCAVQGRHVAITVVVDRLPQRTQAVIGSITGIMSVGFFVLAAWQCGKLATDLWHAGELSPTMRFPFYPLIYGVGFGCLLLSLVLLVNLLKSLAQAVRK